LALDCRSAHGFVRIVALQMRNRQRAAADVKRERG